MNAVSVAVMELVRMNVIVTVMFMMNVASAAVTVVTLTAGMIPQPALLKTALILHLTIPTGWTLPERMNIQQP